MKKAKDSYKQTKITNFLKLFYFIIIFYTNTYNIKINIK